jgi:hypothetical protein
MVWLTGILPCFGGSRRKDFFFEKKKQKTFDDLDPTVRPARVQGPKVFWFFFSKKNILAFFPPIPNLP